MLVINNSSFLPGFNCDSQEIDTEVMWIFQKSREYLEKFPIIGQKIAEDLDRAALLKKSMREAEKHHAEELEVESGSTLFDPREYSEPVDVKLGVGRPRMSADLVLFFLPLRGLWGSVSDHDGWERIKDSLSVQCVLSAMGVKLPGLSTIRENVNNIGNSIRRLILECQAVDILDKRLDDFNEVYVDSAHLEANSAFPTDVDVLFKLINRTVRSILALDDFGLPAALDSWTETRLKKMERHLKSILMNAGKKGLKGKIKKTFRAFLNLSDKVVADLEAIRDQATPFWEVLDLGPMRGYALDLLWDKIERDLQDAAYVAQYARHHLDTGKPIPAREKILSVSDRDAAYIQKGQRQPVIGYKPQLARGGSGFVVGFLAPTGNAADSAMLVPTVENVVSTTGATPLVVSTDDGYASSENVSDLRTLGVVTVSIGGSKGKRLTDEDLWNSPGYVYARSQRSAAESGMFTLKHNHSFGRLRRRGIDAVEGECLEKILAYNFIHMRRLGKRTSEVEENYRERLRKAA